MKDGWPSKCQLVSWMVFSEIHTERRSDDRRSVAIRHGTQAHETENQDIERIYVCSFHAVDGRHCLFESIYMQQGEGCGMDTKLGKEYSEPRPKI